MSTIDDLLARSLLLHRPHVPSDVVPYDDFAGDDLLRWDGYRPHVADDGAAQSLAALCETVVSHCTADQLADFLTDQVPQPRAAWILGCVLQLAGTADGARFWWQYAAGADDAPASYCLYLQHLAQGDTHAAALWQAQSGAYAPQDCEPDSREDAPVHRRMAPDASFATVLRVLSHLAPATPRVHTPVAQAVIEFVDTAVATGYDHHPDFELPVPGTHFAEQLTIVIAAASGRREPHRAPDTVLTGELPNRPPADGPGGGHDPALAAARGPERLLVEVTAADYEPASAHMFFKGAAAVCWKTATVADGADEPGNRMAYHLSRFRTRAASVFSPAPSGFGTPRPAFPQ
ncbi:hypothetical protein [Streptomyces apricus]|uniref:Uncharacterized protein n=1 Tax=Streptomyces apricus TaxID=1828112 RepID=A0A5B0A6Y8_9ACTN|nr:hypothetical protein [Streptomyces apricus]KAA0925613.1 hypothetical protein FGF04_32740 [Streptomyces apricus]